MKMSTYTFSGSCSSVSTQITRLGYECNKWKILADSTYEDEFGQQCRVVVLNVTEWKTQEELEDEAMYGDYENDDYYYSDDYRADIESQKWDWIKNA